MRRHGVAVRLIVPSVHHMAGGVGPVHGAAVGAPSQAVGGERIARHLSHYHRAAGAAVYGVQRGVAVGFGLVHRAYPKAAFCVALAIVGAGGGGVVVQRGNRLQRVTPLPRPKYAVAQGDD